MSPQQSSLTDTFCRTVTFTSHCIRSRNQVFHQKMGRDNTVDSMPFFYRKQLLWQCLFICIQSRFGKKVYSKRKEFAPIGSKFFPFKVDLFKREKISLQKEDKVVTPESIFILLKINPVSYPLCKFHRCLYIPWCTDIPSLDIALSHLYNHSPSWRYIHLLTHRL